MALHKAIEYYGCVLCQKHHFKPEKIYEEHRGFQSKHGIQQMPVATMLKGKTYLAALQEASN